jgi:hypothetical protein
MLRITVMVGIGFKCNTHSPKLNDFRVGVMKALSGCNCGDPDMNVL